MYVNLQDKPGLQEPFEDNPQYEITLDDFQIFYTQIEYQREVVNQTDIEIMHNGEPLPARILEVRDYSAGIGEDSGTVSVWFILLTLVKDGTTTTGYEIVYVGAEEADAVSEGAPPAAQLPPAAKTIFNSFELLTE
jgi:hypothetical protein